MTNGQWLFAAACLLFGLAAAAGLVAYPIQFFFHAVAAVATLLAILTVAAAWLHFESAI